VVVSGTVDASAVVTAKSNSGPDDTVLVVATAAAPGNGTRFAVDGTSLDALQQSWARLVLGNQVVVG
jgi:hypothetical protein